MLPKQLQGSRAPSPSRPAQPPKLRVIALANPKGGVGKTTIATALAVRAAEESRRVALLDLDPQESLASWWTRRGKTKNPKLFEVDAAVEAIELLVSEGWEWVFVDTGPARIDVALGPERFVGLVSQGLVEFPALIGTFGKVSCGSKGATLQIPSWVGSEIGLAQFPTP